jgi:hypothetical protein
MKRRVIQGERRDDPISITVAETEFDVIGAMKYPLSIEFTENLKNTALRLAQRKRFYFH